jgi:hypothetical protein
MRKGHEIGRFMPMEIEPWKSSGTVRYRMKDFQRSWFLELLMAGWANAEMPCHVPNDENSLWTAAGAHSRMYFDAHRAVVIGEFRECGRGLWICNGKSLELYLQKLGIYFRNQKRGKDQMNLKRTYKECLSFLSSCTCLSEKDKADCLAVSPGGDSQWTPSLFSRVEMEAAVGKAPGSITSQVKKCLCYRKQSGEWVICPLCEERKAAQA